MQGTAKKIFWGITILGYAVGVIIGLKIIYNPDNYVYSRTCVESSGPSHANFNGDGPECERYADVKGRENLLVPLLIHGGAGAFVGGWIGLFVSMAYESQEKKMKKKVEEQ